MSMYNEQDHYKFLERIAIALEKLALAPVTGYPSHIGSKAPVQSKAPSPVPLGTVQVTNVPALPVEPISIKLKS